MVECVQRPSTFLSRTIADPRNDVAKVTSLRDRAGSGAEADGFGDALSFALATTERPPRTKIAVNKSISDDPADQSVEANEEDGTGTTIEIRASMSRRS